MRHLAVLLLFIVSTQLVAQSPKTTRPQQQDMSKWAGKYPDAKFFNQPQIKTPLRRILSREDYASISDYNLMTPIVRVGDYLVTNATIKYSTPTESLNVAYGLKDRTLYVVFWKDEQHRKFSTTNHRFDLPDDVLEELGLK